MAAKLANLNDYRKIKTRARVFEALEVLYMEVLTRLENEKGEIEHEELEEFLIQVLGDHLVGDLDSMQDMHQLDENYRRFDARLRKTLQTKMKSLRHFESMRKR